MTAELADRVVIDWTHPSRRTFLANLTWLLPAVGSAFLSWLFGGFTLQPEPLIRSAVIGGIFVLVMIFEMIKTATTRYRVVGDRLEVDRGGLVRARKSVARARIRSVQVTAGPVQRLLGLQRVTVSGGQSSERDAIVLSGLRVADADRLRAALDAAEAPPDQPAQEPGTLLSFRRDWLRYAPLTVWGVGGVVLLALVAQRGLGVLGIQPEQVVAWAAGVLGPVPPWQLGLIGAALLLVLGVALSLIVFVEEWWRLRLTRTASGWLAMERGLLAHRRLGLDLRRLRGVIISEPLLGRLAGGARVEPLTVAAAAEKDEENKSGSLRYLTPVVPRDEAADLAARLLPDAPPLTAPVLRPHPRTALRRRLIRSVLVVLRIEAVPVITALLTGQTIWWIVAATLFVVALPVALVLARAGYRTLGHAVRDGFVIMRSGVIDRRTTALARDGIIGWRIRQSPLQRRSGLMTLTATSAAGRHGGCTMPDLAPKQAEDVINEIGLGAPAVGRRPR